MGDGLLGAADLRELAAELGLRPTKTLGQNFVHDANTVRRIVRTAGLASGERVLEIGPGLGSLTLGLLAAGHPVTAVEIDPLLADRLPATVADRLPGTVADRRPETDLTGREDRLNSDPDLTVVTADALTLTELVGAPPTALVANLPYNVSVPVLLNLLERFPTLAHGLVLVQAEVADRLAAAPGSKIYGVPSAKAAWYAQVDRAGAVSRTVFWPVPNVDSGLIRFARRPSPAAAAGRVAVFAVIDAAFAQRRKTLRSALAVWAGSAAQAEQMLRVAGVDPSARGETLDVATFARIADAALA